MNQVVAMKAEEADNTPERFQRSRHLIVIVSLLIAVVSLLILHLQVTKLNEDYQGTLLAFDRLFDLSLALSITALAFCIGRRVCRFLQVDFYSGAEELAFSSMLGVG